MASLASMGAVLMLAGHAGAHDFWLSPSSHSPDVGERVDVSTRVGHAEDQTPWPLNPHRVIALRSWGPDGLTDHQASMTAYPNTDRLPMRFSAPGAHILTIETTAAFSELNAARFNDYIDEEGLDPVIRHRKTMGTTQLSGREVYSRRGKALINVSRDSEDMTQAPSDWHSDVSQPLGLTLEVVPALNYQYASGDLEATLIYRGRAVPGITAVLVPLGDQVGGGNEDQDFEAVSDAEGRVRFARPVSGQWMIHTVWSDPLEDRREADYDTIFSSLTFEIGFEDG